MLKKLLSTALIFTFAFSIIAAFSGREVYASRYINDDTGYYVIVEDDADLLTDEEEKDLAQEMKGITAYGSIVYKSIDSNSTTARKYAEDYSYTNFKNDSNAVFLIDMDNRQIYIAAAGELNNTITTAKANTITDNIYRYASRGDYYGCAAEAFKQMNALLSGQAIAEPMKHICNAILALIIAMLIFFIVVNRSVSLKRRSMDSIMEGTAKAFVAAGAASAVFRNETRSYSPIRSSSGGSGGGGGFSGGGGGGGGFSGGGGGHGF